MDFIANPLNPDRPFPAKSIVIVGMPGAGKSSIGRRLAGRLSLSFADSDAEIEEAAGMSVDRIFDLFGEVEFRAGERRVIQRLLSEGPRVISTGGGALTDPATRELIGAQALSVWLRVDMDILFERISRRATRPLLQGDETMRRAKLETLLAERVPFYEAADVIVDGDRRPTEETVSAVLEALSDFVAAGKESVFS